MKLFKPVILESLERILVRFGVMISSSNNVLDEFFFGFLEMLELITKEGIDRLISCPLLR